MLDEGHHRAHKVSGGGLRSGGQALFLGIEVTVHERGREVRHHLRVVRAGGEDEVLAQAGRDRTKRLDRRVDAEPRAALAMAKGRHDGDGRRELAHLCRLPAIVVGRQDRDERDEGIHCPLDQVLHSGILHGCMEPMLHFRLQKPFFERSRSRYFIRDLGIG